MSEGGKGGNTTHTCAFLANMFAVNTHTETTHKHTCTLLSKKLSLQSSELLYKSPRDAKDTH